MALINHVAVICRWVASGSDSYPEITDIVSLIAGESVEDVTGQQQVPGVDSTVITAPPLLIVEAHLYDANFTIVQAHAKTIVLARRQYDEVTLVDSINNFNSVLTQAHVDAFRSALISKYTADGYVENDDLFDKGTLLIQVGITRKEMMRDYVIPKWRGFLKASS